MSTTSDELPLENKSNNNNNNKHARHIQQLTFIDYDDLQTRLVLLPRDEDDEGMGAVVSMYYDTTKGHPSNNKRDGTTDTSDRNDDMSSLILDDSVTGYVLLHISSGDDENRTIPTVTTTQTDTEHDTMWQSSHLLDEDFASILSTIRNHPTPIVLTFSNYPTHESAENVAVVVPIDTMMDHSNITMVDTNTDVDAPDKTNTGGGTTNSTTTNSVATALPKLNVPNVVVNGDITFEEEKKSEDGTTVGTNTSTDHNTNATTIPPPPPTESLEENNEAPTMTSSSSAATASSVSLSPNTLFTTTKHLSSWTSRMSAVAVTKATALAKAANEQAKVTSAMVVAAVAPDFPNTTTTAANHNSNHNIPSTAATAIPAATDTRIESTISTNSSNNDIVVDQCVELSSIVDDNHGPDKLQAQSTSTTTTAPTDVGTAVATTTTTNTPMSPDALKDRPIRIPLPDLHIYVQQETGAFVPLPEIVASTMEHSSDFVSPTKSNPTSSSLMTNSSYIMVRINPQQPAPNKNDARYQWYRSGDNNNTWVKLPGATGPSLQPSATEIGYRLRCMISSIESMNDIGDATSTLVCETADIVTASIPILNGSRQALARGAQFGGLLGLGKAEGRTFCIKIVLSSLSPSSLSSNQIDRRKSFSDNGSSSHHSTSSHSTIAAVTIYQVAGKTAEPIHPENEPLFCRAATVWDYNQIKSIALIFQSNDIAPSASMVAALCSTDHDDEDDEMHELANHRLYFRLQAPNRLARESMLLSLGIANFQGKPSELNDRSRLFHDDLFYEGSGSASSSLGDDSIVSQSSSIAWQSSATPEKITVQRRTASFTGGASIDGMKSDRENELEALRSKLARKDKVISELQRQVTHSDEAQRQTEDRLCSVQKELAESQKELLGLQNSLIDVNTKLNKANCEIQSIKVENDARSGVLESDIQVHKDRVLALERENRTLQNDKDVLKAAVESRDFKLCKMEELQTSLDEARVKLSQRNNFQLELDEANQRYNDTLKEVERLKMSNSAYMDERRIALERIGSLDEALQSETSKNSSHQSKLEMEQMKVQKLKAERNSYKQKGDSLAKEMSRICRDGRTIREIEKILADDATRREEVNVLREQKRKALEQVEHFRTAYEQLLGMQKLAGIDIDTGKLLERNAELERLLSELTEYLNAKEMQLDTMKQVNDTLQSEIRHLARASMSKNDI